MDRILQNIDFSLLHSDKIDQNKDKNYSKDTFLYSCIIIFILLSIFTCLFIKYYSTITSDSV